MVAESDEELVRKAIAGDKTALETLFRRYYATIFAFAQKICGDASLAEDISQDVVIKLMGSLRTFDGRSKFSSWLYRVVLSMTLDHRRKESRRRLLKLEFGKARSKAEPPGQDVAVTARQLWDIVLALPAAERDVAVLVLGEGLTQRETAEVLGCPIGTVGWRLSKAMKRLNRTLECESDEETGTQKPSKRVENRAAFG